MGVAQKAAFILLFTDQALFHRLVKTDGDCIRVYSFMRAAADKNIPFNRPLKEIGQKTLLEALVDMSNDKLSPTEKARVSLLVFA